MNQGERFAGGGKRQRSQVGAINFSQDSRGPVDGGPREIVEQVGIEEPDRRRIMIAEQNGGASLSDDLRALIRLGAVSDDIPKADYLVDRLFPDILKHRFERFEVGMDIGYEGSTHNVNHFP